MIAIKDDARLDDIREQGLGMASVLRTEIFKRHDTIKTLGLFRKWLQGSATTHSYLLPIYGRTYSTFREEDERVPSLPLLLNSDPMKLN